MGYKILVTGGAGYIGSILVPELLQRSHQVTVLDDFRHGDEVLKSTSHPSLKIVVGDVRDTKVITSLVSQADVIIPLAGIVGAPSCSDFPEEAKGVNVEAIRMMMPLLSREQRVLYSSTCSVFGDASVEKVTEETPPKPLSLYAETKLLAEKIVMEHPLSTSFRLSTAFGVSPRMRDDLLLNFLVSKAISKKYLTLFQSQFRRSFVHVRDIAVAFLTALEKTEITKGQIFNVVHEEGNLTKWELAAMIQEQLPFLLLSTSDTGSDLDGRNYFVSGAKFSTIGYSPKYSMKVGISELIQHYRVRSIAQGTGTRTKA